MKQTCADLPRLKPYNGSSIDNAFAIESSATTTSLEEMSTNDSLIAHTNCRSKYNREIGKLLQKEADSERSWIETLTRFDS